MKALNFLLVTCACYVTVGCSNVPWRHDCPAESSIVSAKLEQAISGDALALVESSGGVVAIQLLQTSGESVRFTEQVKDAFKRSISAACTNNVVIQSAAAEPHQWVYGQLPDGTFLLQNRGTFNKNLNIYTIPYP